MSRLIARSKGHRGLIPTRLLMLVRKILAAPGNRLVGFELGGGEILLPLGHDLPLIRASFPQYSTNIARLCTYISTQYPDLHVIDIGANVGDTIAIIREFSQCPILCIEGDAYYFGLLSNNIQHAHFQFAEAVKAFVATDTGIIKGQLISVQGTAHLEENGTSETKTIRLSELLNNFPKFQSAKLLKIDTDGFDCSILRSEVDWLGKSKPVIFFEYDPFFFQQQSYDGAHIFKDLAAVGYDFAIFYDNFGDYLTSVDLLRDTQILVDLQNYYVGRGGKQYADVAVFHADDRALAESVRTQEAAWSLRSREVRSL